MQRPVSVGTGLATVTGSTTGLFESSTLVDKHLAYEETSQALVLFNGTTDAYVFEIPSLQYSGGSTPQAGQSQDVIETMPWGAQKETTAPVGTSGTASIRIWKFT